MLKGSSRDKYYIGGYMKGIYCIENLDTSKKYYGSSMDVEWRLEQHRRGLRKGKHINVYLQRSYNLHGLDRFYFSLVEDMGYPTKKELQVREQWYIDTNLHGYNIAPANGGDTLSNHPDREIIIEDRANKFREWMSNLTEQEKKDRFSKPGKSNPNWRNGGRKILCPVCQSTKIEPKTSTCGGCRNRSGEQNPFYGKSHSDEALDKLRLAGGKWIKGIDPSLLPYTTYYEIIYPDGSIKQVAGLKAIANEFKVSIANVHATIKRMDKGIMPSKSVFKNHFIRKIN